MNAASASAAPGPRARLTPARRPAAGWLGLLVLVAPLGLLDGGVLLAVIGALLGAGVVLAAARRPDLALLALVVLLAVQLPLLSLALELGVPARAVRAGGFLKELLVAGVLVAGLSAIVVRRQRLDALDRAALAYLALVLAYVAVAVVTPRAGRDLLPRSPDGVFLQAVALRALVVGPALLLAVRALDLGRAFRRRLASVVLAVSALLAAGALVEVLATGWWERVTGGVLDYTGYQRALFGIELDRVVVRTEVAGRLVDRAGSLLFDYLQLGFFLLPGLAIALLRFTRDASLRSGALLALLGAGVLATVTRSAILAAAVTAVVLGSRVVSPVARRQLQRVGLAALVVLLLVAVPSGLAARMVAVVTGTDESAAAHVASLEQGLDAVRDAPLGIGLATTAETAPRGEGPAIVAENAYLDVAVQVGIVGLALFGLFLLLLVRALLRRRGPGPWPAIALSVIAGLAVGAALLHVWTMLETTWVAFAVAGVATPRRG